MTYELLIGGAWRAAGAGSYAVVNPATEETVGEAPEASVTDVQAAAAAAREAFPAWSRTPREERARLLQAVADRVRQRYDDLLPLIIAETGATLAVGSKMQVPMCASRFERYARGALQDLDVPLAPQAMDATPLGGGGRDRDRDRSPLSQREREIVVLVAQGFKNKEMAEKMFISEQTVKNHLHNIFDKLGVSDRLELALYAIHKNIHTPA